MNRKTALLLVALLSGIGADSHAQYRLKTNNTIVWLNQFHTINFDQHWAILAEYQWRRTNGLKDWQQSLLRGGLQYKFRNGVSVLAGYGWIETFPYGDYPPAASQPFPEQRIYEQMVWNENIGRLQLNHRGRLEQRFLGVLDPTVTGERSITRWNYQNRLRYQIKASLPLNNATLIDNTWYAGAFDEIMIGFGKNVNANIFDQNRVALLIGYKLSRILTFELAAFNQTVQQPAMVNGKPVFQYNTGALFNAYFNWR